MKMKKIAAIIFSAAMVLNMGAAAMAEGSITVGDKTYSDSTTVTIDKVYKLVGEGTSPAETFTLTQIGEGVVVDGDAPSAPALETITGATYASGAASANGTSGTITVELPTYTTVGVYEYTLQETNNNTAGVTYRPETIKLVVTVMQGDDGKVRVAAVHTEESGQKKDTFDNTYSAGSLAVTKNVTGNMGDKDKEFTVKVTFNAPNGKSIREAITYTDGTEEKTIPANWGDGTASADITLKHGETVTFENIPYDVTYTVVENDYTADGYDVASYKMNGIDASDGSGMIDSAADTVEITNNKGGEVDTGINLDSMPYIMILCLVAVCAVVLFVRKRTSANR